MADAATFVPESVLKKRRTQDEIKAKRAAAALAQRRKAKDARKEYFKRAERYVKEYKAAERALVRQRRQAKATGNYFAEPENKLALVIRIRGIMGVSPKVRKILQLLRLRQIHNAVFLRINPATLKMLQLVAPFVAWGYPSLKTVRGLIYKRGFGKVNKQRMPLTDNTVIEGTLGTKTSGTVICMEDLVHEIYTVGDNCKAANNFLWPFKLSSPSGGFSKKLLHYNEGGESGNREVKINALVKKML
jgi:60S ribosomal protein uL30